MEGFVLAEFHFVNQRPCKIWLASKIMHALHTIAQAWSGSSAAELSPTVPKISTQSTPAGSSKWNKKFFQDCNRKKNKESVHCCFPYTFKWYTQFQNSYVFDFSDVENMDVIAECECVVRLHVVPNNTLSCSKITVNHDLLGLIA